MAEITRFAVPFSEKTIIFITASFGVRLLRSHFLPPSNCGILASNGARLAHPSQPKKDAWNMAEFGSTYRPTTIVFTSDLILNSMSRPPHRANDQSFRIMTSFEVVYELQLIHDRLQRLWGIHVIIETGKRPSMQSRCSLIEALQRNSHLHGEHAVKYYRGDTKQTIRNFKSDGVHVDNGFFAEMLRIMARQIQEGRFRVNFQRNRGKKSKKRNSKETTSASDNSVTGFKLL